MSDRRDFLKKAGLLGLAGITSKLVSNEQINTLENFGKEPMPVNTFKLPPLPYAYNAMEPFIDAQTMEIHYTKHHQAYVNKLNEAAATTKIDFSVDDAIKCKSIDASTPAVIRNNLGGHYNHSLFWTMLKPNPEAKPNLPKGKLAEMIDKNFKSFDDFKKEFTEKATKNFGSGWCWLIEQDKNLLITVTPNQDNPLMKVTQHQGKILMGLDIWEHAYYLKYQNKRPDYIEGWWNLANWDKAEELYTQK